MRRKYQQGSVFQKGRKQSDQWLAEEPAYVRFWTDVPGQQALKRSVIPLEPCRTLMIAERAEAEKM
jgi:hypothetical protein